MSARADGGFVVARATMGVAVILTVKAMFHRRGGFRGSGCMTAVRDLTDS